MFVELTINVLLPYKQKKKNKKMESHLFSGADMIKNDGVYSAYFLGFTSNGRYGLSVSSQKP